MVRNYKKKTDRMKYTEEEVAKALLDVQGGTSLRVAAATYSIPYTTLQQRYTGRSQSPRKIGRKTALLQVEEMALAQNLATLGDFGFALDAGDLRDFVKHYLDSSQRMIGVFVNNRPGIDWVRGFLDRHSKLLSCRMCQNISRKRAAVTEADVVTYFGNLGRSLEGVPAANIVNYDETNLTDDPKGKLQIFRKGVKHAERIMNTTKSSTSIMFAVSAAGKVLSPYIVYKAERIQDTWILGGPLGAHYNRTKSGWFDSDVFVDWFEKVALRYFATLPADEPKVLVGDNLASHINYKVVELCQRNNIRMVFLIPNSTHMLQPLDVAVYGPLKVVWRKIITDWKEGEGKHATTFPKWVLPKLLLKLMHDMDEKWCPLAKSGFKTCGIHPLNSEPILKKMRHIPEDTPDGSLVSPRMLEYLQEKRETSVKHNKRPRGKQVKLAPGVSISLADMLESGPSGTQGSAQSGTQGSAQSGTQGSAQSHNEDSAPKPKRCKRKLTFDGKASDVSCSNDPPAETAVVPETNKVEDLTVGDYVLSKFVTTDKQAPTFYIGKVTATAGSRKWEVSYYRKCDVPMHVIRSLDDGQGTPPNLLAFKEPTVRDMWVTEEADMILKPVLETVSKNCIVFRNIFGNRMVR